MSSATFFDPNSSPVAGMLVPPYFLESVDTPLPGNVLSNADISSVQNLPYRYWKVSGAQVLAMTTQEQNSVDAAIAAAELAAARSSAQSILTSQSDFGKLERAVADIIVNQLNLHTTWEAALAAAVAGAATLAALKTAVAAITPVPSVSLAQAKTAILSDIAAGTEGD